MTYCIGWKTDKSVFIVSDSLLSVEAKIETNQKSMTALGEKNYNDECILYDNALKIYNFDDKLILAASGFLDPILEFVDYFSKNLIKLIK